MIPVNLRTTNAQHSKQMKPKPTTIASSLAAAALSIMALHPSRAYCEAPPEEKPDGPRVQLAILLDTSSSMEGLIEQAKTQLWKIINTFISAKQGGKVPFVEVALYEYGNDGLNSESHWIRRIQPLTRDLDKVSEELFALRTNGGQEYCGAVVKRATEDLQWDPSGDTYKAIFIAGNEPFTQGPVEPVNSCKAAIAKGIIVNTIHCGTEAEGIDGGWQKGAKVADGSYLVIDSNKAVVHIEAPQDAEIVKLNEELNKTYIAYGAEAPAAAANQVAQDANAARFASGGAMVQRAVAKASANYSNGRWDLVDASKQKDFDLSKVKEADLPKEMQSLDEAGRKAFVETKAKERGVLQERILDLNKQRDAFVATKRREQAKDGKETLDTVMADTVRKQAAAKGLKFE